MNALRNETTIENGVKKDRERHNCIARQKEKQQENNDINININYFEMH